MSNDQALSVEDPERWLRAGPLLRLALPAATAALLHNAYRPLDQLYVSWLGKEAQGALGASVFVLILAYALHLLISAGVAPLVGRATGVGDVMLRRRWVGAGLLGAAGVALLMALAGVFATDSIVSALGLQGLAAEHARAYLSVMFLTGGALAFGPLLDGCFSAMGNTLLPLVLQGGVIVINAVLTPLLVYTAGLGVGGAALGSTIAQTVGVVVGIWLLQKATGFGWSDVIGPEWASRLRRIVGIGAPVMVGTALYALVYWAMLATSITPLGDAVVAGLGIGFSGLEAFAWPVFLGCSVAAASLVGRCLGAGRPDLARRAVRLLLWPQIGLGVLVGAVFWFLGPTIVVGFAADSDAAREATLYALILAWSQPLVALEALFEGVLNGSGDTRSSFWGTVPYNLLRVPLALFLAFGLGYGAMGIWWTINLTSLLKAGTKGYFVWRGKWAELAI